LFVVPEGEVAALTATYDNGFWIEYPDGSYENLSPEEAQAINYENVTNYLKSTKALYNWSDEVATPFGLPLEIVPLENPFALGIGDNLSVRVLYQGNAIANPTVEYLGQELAIDANGIASVPIVEGGLQVIEASYDNPTASSPGISHATIFTAQTVTAQSTSVPEPSFLLAFGVIGATTLALKRNKS
jgi:nickel transport protein